MNTDFCDPFVQAIIVALPDLPKELKAAWLERPYTLRNNLMKMLWEPDSSLELECEGVPDEMTQSLFRALASCEAYEEYQLMRAAFKLEPD